MNMKQSPKVAFVIVCWNNEDILNTCLDSIKKQTYSNIVTYFLDNNSSDKSVEKAKEIMPSINIIQAEDNYGFAKGNNIAIDAALQDPDVEYVALLNTDAAIDENWLETLVEFTRGKGNIATLQTTTLDYYDPSIIDSTHIYVARNTQATQGNWRASRDAIEFGPRKIFGVNAAACLITREYIEKQPFKELFDEDFFMYLEDVDLAARATVMGWDNYNVPGAYAHHMGSASSGKNPGFSLGLTFTNNSAMIFKNFPMGLIFRMIPSLIRSDIDTSRHLKRIGKHKEAKIIYKARVKGLIKLPIYVRKRMVMSNVRTISSDYLWHLMKNGY